MTHQWPDQLPVVGVDKCIKSAQNLFAQTIVGQFFDFVITSSSGFLKKIQNQKNSQFWVFKKKFI